MGGRGWLLEWNIEGVVGKVTPSFKDSQPFLSKIVAFLVISVTWSFHDRSFAIVRPSSFVPVTNSTSFPSMMMGIKTLCSLAKEILSSLHLSAFSWTLFSCDHSITLLAIACTCSFLLFVLFFANKAASTKVKANRRKPRTLVDRVSVKINLQKKIRCRKKIKYSLPWFVYFRAKANESQSLKPGFHIVVSVVSVVSVERKKFIAQIEFILSRTTSCICRFFCIEHLYGRFP